MGDSLEVSQHVGCTEEHSSRVCDIPADSLSEGMSGTLIQNTRQESLLSLHTHCKAAYSESETVTVHV